MSIQKAIYEAASRVGRDGKGKDGAVGYFMWLAVAHPATYSRLLIAFSGQADSEANLMQQHGRQARQWIRARLLGPP